jgi:hypothetical protein
MILHAEPQRSHRAGGSARVFEQEETERTEGDRTMDDRRIVSDLSATDLFAKIRPRPLFPLFAPVKQF